MHVALLCSHPLDEDPRNSLNKTCARERKHNDPNSFAVHDRTAPEANLLLPPQRIRHLCYADVLEAPLKVDEEFSGIFVGNNESQQLGIRHP